MSIPFQVVPSNLRVPLFYAEVNNQLANTASSPKRTLIIGQKSNLSTFAIDSVNRITSAAEGVAGAGRNSLLAQMIDDYWLNDPSGEVYVAALKDNVAGTAATGSIAFTAQATASGTYTVYIGGRKYQMGVTPSMTVTQLGDALAAVITADKRACITAANVTGTVTFTSAHKGPLHNDFPINEYWGGTLAGEIPPAGLATTITAFSGGATPPTLTTMLTNCGDRTFDYIICPYVDSTSLDALKSFLDDVTGRWSWLYQLYGHVFAGSKGTLTQLVTAGTARNNQHETLLGWNNANSPAWRLAAAYGGASALSLRQDPALPLATVVIRGMYPPKKADRFQITDQNQLLYSGVSTFTVDDDGTMRIQKLITTYQTNAFGQADNSYLSVHAMFTLMEVLRRMRSAVTTKFARVKLAGPGTRFTAPNVVTTDSMRAEMIAEYNSMEEDGLVQGSDLFADGVVVELDSGNPNRVNALWPGYLIGQLDIFALLAQFRLSTLS